MSPPARRPDSGSTTRTPRRRRVARFSCTDACSHISVCIAGHTMTGARVAITTAVRRSRRQAGRVRGEEASRRGSDDHEIGGLPEASVRDRITVIPQRRVHGLGSERGERRLTDEAVRVARHDRHDVRTEVDEASAHLDRLVGGDAARDPQDDAAPGEARHGSTRLLPRRRRPRPRPALRRPRPPRPLHWGQAGRR